MGAMFIFRVKFLKLIVPDMAEKANSWDFANDASNNAFSLMFFFAILIVRFFVASDQKAVYFASIPLGISAGDVIDRFYLGITSYQPNDLRYLILVITLPLVVIFFENQKPKLKQKLKNLWHLPK